MADPLPPIDAPTRRRGWSPVTIVALGCGGMLAVVVLFIVGISALVLRSMQGSGAYQSALATVQASPSVREALGEPIVPGWWVMGSIAVSGPSGSASMSFPVSGPKGRGEVFVEARKRAGEWTFDTLTVEPAGQARLDLLTEPGRSR